LITDRGNFCGIGRLAEVRFPRKAFNLPAIVGQALHWMTAALDRMPPPIIVGSI